MPMTLTDARRVLYRRQLERYSKLLTAQIRLCKQSPTLGNINERKNLEDAAWPTP